MNLIQICASYSVFLRPLYFCGNFRRFLQFLAYYPRFRAIPGPFLEAVPKHYRDELAYSHEQDSSHG